MGNTVTGINDGTGQRAVSYFRRCPRGGKGEDSLNGNVETSTVKRFKENLGGILTVLRRI